jgi:hypothetical protein
MNCFQSNQNKSTNIDSTVLLLDHSIIDKQSFDRVIKQDVNYRHQSKDLIQSIHSCNLINIFVIIRIQLISYQLLSIQNLIMKQMIYELVSTYKLKLIWLTNMQDITKSNKNVVCISRIEKISNNNILKLDYGQSH